MTTFVRCAGGEEALLDTLNFHLYRLPDLSVASGVALSIRCHRQPDRSAPVCGYLCAHLLRRAALVRQSTEVFCCEFLHSQVWQRLLWFWPAWDRQGCRRGRTPAELPWPAWGTSTPSCNSGRLLLLPRPIPCQARTPSVRGYWQTSWPASSRRWRKISRKRLPRFPPRSWSRYCLSGNGWRSPMPALPCCRREQPRSVATPPLHRPSCTIWRHSSRRCSTSPPRSSE